jgi:hypothetical protein
MRSLSEPLLEAIGVRTHLGGSDADGLKTEFSPPVANPGGEFAAVALG